MVVDAHHHFWDPARADYPWLTDELAPIRRAFGPDDLRPLLAEAGVDGTVLVQTRSSLEETRELLAIAAATDFVAGVVGWVDLAAADAGATLAALRADGPWLVGIRHQVHDEPDPQWLLRPDVRRGLRAVGEAGLVYDLLVRPRELPAALAVARDLPETRFVIDHAAKPRIRAGAGDAVWAERLAPFADLANVHCKLSGLVTEANWTGWRTEDLAPYVERVLGWFGAGRVLFGSDWPVCLLAAPYERVLEALRELLPGDAVPEVLGENARRVYRLASPVPQE
ncbi:MAG TPA: amidohydrolase family protein [Candidatus Dormibacteraeota bacterium]|nr:amidohydrolase family protein [Candidatus Dormibacteraeota bacterium]